ncbi:hypothetical protein [Roseateles violae]|uniref:Uncharacterized protein n=1 Tax=Roseateles violae TaxID=3058042 RepID=A0ABT8DUB0_9BURK|nr:hypothetical protein [Pelomonas sp. PFR6]MDN3920638.1 hypothetical protein [Pelomonas sp. PFR6]
MLSTQVNSPFAMLLDPEQVVRAIEHSERLNRLHSRVYRPLDKPIIPKNDGKQQVTADFDRLIDAAPEEIEEIFEDGNPQA